MSSSILVCMDNDMAAEIERLHECIESLAKRLDRVEACTPFTLGSTDLSETSPALTHLKSLGISW